jgi:hypothetical protein
MIQVKTRQIRKYSVLLAFSLLSLLASEELLAQFINNGAARANVRGTSRRTSRRVNRRHDYFYGGRYGGGYYGAPVAAGAVAGVATAAVLTSLPGGCSPYNNYYNCGGNYYQPQMQGTEVVYIQVDADDIDD